MPSEFFWSYLRMMKPNGSFAVQGSTSIKCSSINDGIYQSLALGAKWIFLMDVDQIYPDYTIPRLLESCKKYDAKIMSVLYHCGKAPFAPVAGWSKEIDHNGQKGTIYTNAKGNPWKGEYYPLGNGVVEVEWAGSGGLLIHKDVIDAIGWPPFIDVWENGQGIRNMGHDVNFCYRAKGKGYKVYVDTDVCSDHGRLTYISGLWAKSFTESGMLETMGANLTRQTQDSGYWDTIWQTENLKGIERKDAYRETFDDVAALVDEKSSVADMGCGNGTFLEYLKEKRNAVCHGLDFSSSAIDVIKSKGFEGSIADFRNFEPNGLVEKFDTVVSLHTLEHLIEDGKFLKAMKALCRVGGKVVLATPHLEEIQGYFEHFHQYTENDLKYLMSQEFSKYEVKKNRRDYIVVGYKDNV